MSTSPSSSISLSVRLVSLLSLSLPLFSAGCSDEACFQWTEAEGACPAEGEALAFFQNPTCPGLSEIESVDSEGTFDDDACCYSVTQRYEDDYAVDCSGSLGGFAAVTTAVATGGGGFGGGPSVATAAGVGGMGGGGGVGGAGGGDPCTRCGEAYTSGDTSNLCSSSEELLYSLSKCMCEGPCASVCGSECTSANPMSKECEECRGDTSMGCGNQFNDCANDI